MKPESLPVLFRMGEGECVAVFPTLEDRPGIVTCYAHIGQHGSCSRDWYFGTKKATPEQYAPLLAELRGIYENPHYGEPVALKVTHRWPQPSTNRAGAAVALRSTVSAAGGSLYPKH
jgi:hypothetical protein